MERIYTSEDLQFDSNLNNIIRINNQDEDELDFDFDYDPNEMFYELQK